MHEVAATDLLERTYTPDEVESWEDAFVWELDDDGRLLERALCMHSDEVAARVTARLHVVIEDRLGRVLLGGTGLNIFPSRPKRMPRGDVVFISFERLAGRRLGTLKVAPDLVVEVVSPGDNAAALNKKAHEYLAGGVRLVWIIYPETRTVLVFRGDGTVAEFGPGDTITGEDLIPGFEAQVSSFFPNYEERPGRT